MQINSGSPQFHINDTETTQQVKATQPEKNDNNISTASKTEGKKEATPYPIISAMDAQLEESFKKFKEDLIPQAALRTDAVFENSNAIK